MAIGQIAALSAQSVPFIQMRRAIMIKNIVLVHGGFVDGAGWRGVYDILKKDSFTVSIVQNPTISLAGDVSATRMILDA